MQALFWLTIALHGRRHRELMARPGLEPVRTASPVTGMDAFTAGEWPFTADDGETRTRTGDTTIFRQA